MGRKKGCITWNKGLTKEIDERVRKISESRKGMKLSEEHKRNISKANKGKVRSKEMREKISCALKGKTPKNLKQLHKNSIGGKLTEEHKRKIGNKMKGVFAGEKNPNWQGGISFEPYDEKFNNFFKRSIRKRDNQICMLCGVHREKMKRTLDVHHINYNKLLSVPQNCISLCRNCHMKTGINRKPWVRFFQDLLSERYSYPYTENQEIKAKLFAI